METNMDLQGELIDDNNKKVIILLHISQPSMFKLLRYST